MLQDTISWITPITTGLLGIAGICALLAIVTAVVRYFINGEHSSQDRSALTGRVIHVFGYIAVFCLLLGGGGQLADSVMNNAASNQIKNEAGTSWTPSGVNNGNRYNNLGDMLADSANKQAQNGPGLGEAMHDALIYSPLSSALTGVEPVPEDSALAIDKTAAARGEALIKSSITDAIMKHFQQQQESDKPKVGYILDSYYSGFEALKK